MSARIKSWMRNRVLTEEDKKAIETAKQIDLMRQWGAIVREAFPETEIKGIGPKYVYMPRYGVKRYTNDRELRELARTPTPAACVQRLVNDFVSTPWKIIPVDPKKKNQQHIDAITQKFYNPNQYAESFQHIMAKFVRDVLEIDAGVMTKSYATAKLNENRPMTQFFARDGASFLKDLDGQGNLGRYYEGEHTFTVKVGKRTVTRRLVSKTIGYWQHATHRTVPIPFEPFEVVYGCQNPLSYRVYGQSKVEVLELRLKTLIQSDVSTEQYFRGGEVAKNLLTLEETLIGDADWERFVKRLEQQIKESPFNVIPTDHKGTLQRLSLTRSELQWLEQQKEYRLSVLAMFNVTPVMLGWTEDVPKATDESQREVYLRKGLWPLLRLFEYKMNMEVVSEFFVSTEEHKGPYAGKKPDCYFTFDLYDPIEEQRWLERSEIAAKCGIKTVNEMRAERNRLPLPWGDFNPAALLAIQQFAQGHFMAPDVITAEVFQLITGIPTEQQALKMLKEFVPLESAEKEDYWKHKWEAYKKQRSS